MTEFTSEGIAEARESLTEQGVERSIAIPVQLEMIDHIEQQAKQIAELEQERERRWIPVNERLPEKSGFYFLHICGTDGKKWERVGLFFVDGQFDIINDKVTHWQPLPNPPSEEE